jgi:hypothetical protein
MFQDVDSTNYFCSPLYAPEEVLYKLPSKIAILSAQYDPLLDEYVLFFSGGTGGSIDRILLSPLPPLPPFPPLRGKDPGEKK